MPDLTRERTVRTAGMSGKPHSPNERAWETGAMTDGELADAILRKIVADREGCILVERYGKGGIGGLIDSSWFDLTPEEADYLDRLHAAHSE